MGLRLNGVDDGELKNVQISDIRSWTDIGTLLGGKYENIVSQQAPYMKGFSMNMVNGISLTFSKNIILNDVAVNTVISKTGLSYGLALWYDTEIEIGNISMKHVHAGQGLDESEELTEDSYPNLEPEACAVRIYDDERYRVRVHFGDTQNERALEQLDIKCVFGHTGCLMQDEVYSHLGDVDNDDVECVGSDEMEQPMMHFLDGLTERNVERGTSLWNILVILMVAVTFMVIMHCLMKCVQNRCDIMLNDQTTECSPLL